MAKVKRVKFAKFTQAEEVAVGRIIARARPMFRKVGLPRTAMEIRMDLAAVHAQVPLRLADLALADGFNFGHDLAGIARHLDRETGILGGHFRPRYAVRKREVWDG